MDRWIEWARHHCRTAPGAAHVGCGLVGYRILVREGVHGQYLDDPAKVGEVQVLHDFDAMLATAQAARARAFPDAADRRLTEDERSQIWAELSGGTGR